MGRRLFLPVSPAIWALEEIRQQTLLLRDTLDGDISDELILFSDLKSRVNKYVLELWQSEFPENKLHKSFRHLNDCTVLKKELHAYTGDIKTWTIENQLKVNDNKTEALLFPFFVFLETFHRSPP